MCAPASMVLTKDKVFWSKKSDSHEEIIKEYGLHADGVRGANVARIEITPAGNDFRLPLEQWVYKLDQDQLPKWYDAAEVEARVRLELPNWLASKVVLPGQVIDELKDADLLVVYGTINRVCGSATINEVCGSATINRVCDSATIKYVCDSATINEVCDSATIKYVCDSATIKYVYDSATIKYVCGSATINRVCGSATINEVYGSATINRVCDSATIKYVYGNSVVSAYHTIDPSILKSNGAVLIIRDSSNNKPTVYVGIQDK